MSKSDYLVMFQCGDHDRATYMGCLTCDQRKDQEVDRLRRDLATRDRELAEARYERDQGIAAHTAVDRAWAKDRDQARAALSEKDEECRRLRAELNVTEQKHKVACEDAVRCGDLAASRLTKLAEKEREVADWRTTAETTASNAAREREAHHVTLAAAQEEAKGLRGEVTAARAAMKDLAVFSMSAQSDPNRLAEQYRGDLAAVCNRAMAAMDAMEARIAARQQQPDGKKEDGNG